jgi:uncharacterized protein (DUF433 family)
MWPSGPEQPSSYKTMPRKQRKLLGCYIVADPEICHGKPTFIGTRFMVWQVLDMVAEGMSWDAITAQWPGSFTKEAIAEALQLARRTFDDHAAKYGQERRSPKLQTILEGARKRFRAGCGIPHDVFWKEVVAENASNLKMQADSRKTSG